MIPMLKHVVKASVLEALAEFFNSSEETTTYNAGSNSRSLIGNGGLDLDDPEKTESEQDNSTSTEGNSSEDTSGKGGGSEESSGGSVGPGGKPKPDVGVGVFGLR